MCGLVGIYSSWMLNKHKEALAALLYLDTWRGRDSTGVAAVRQNTDTHILKSTVPGYEFVEGPKLEQHLRLNDFCWIGHNRYGTVGKNIKTNAHPFEILDEDGGCILVGAHNGTLKNKHVLMDHNRFGTDSEALFNHIANTSIEDTIPLVEGAWALTYYDHIAEELRILRNKERPLFYAFEEGKKTFFWASEMWMLRVACSRFGIKLEEDKVFSFAEDTLYSLPAPMKTNEVLTLERKGGLAGKQPTFFQGGWKREARTGGSRGDATYTKAAAPSQSSSQTSSTAIIAATSTTPSGTPTKNNGEKQETTNDPSSDTQSNDTSDNVVAIDKAKVFKGYAGKAISKAELEEMLANGCGWCEKEFINFNDKYGWLAPGKAVCVKCLEGGHDEIVTPQNVSVH